MNTQTDEKESARKTHFANQLAFVRSHMALALDGLSGELAALVERSRQWDLERFFEEGNGAYRVAVNHAYAKVQAGTQKKKKNQAARADMAELGRQAQFVLDNWERLGSAEKERLLGLDLLRPMFEANYKKGISESARDVWFGNAVCFSSTFDREDVAAVYTVLAPVVSERQRVEP